MAKMINTSRYFSSWKMRDIERCLEVNEVWSINEI